MRSALEARGRSFFFTGSQPLSTLKLLVDSVNPLRRYRRMRRLGGSVAQTEIKNLLALVDEAYNHAAWHGPNLRGSMRGVTARQAALRPGPGRHNIWEIAVHAAYWKYTVRRRLLGEKRGSFSVQGSNFFARPVDRSEKAWRADVALLESEHRKLRETVASIQPNDLDHRARGSKTIVRRLIAGIAFHDVYHAGQIQLIKAFLKTKKKSR
jgi:DinB family protein